MNRPDEHTGERIFRFVAKAVSEIPPLPVGTNLGHRHLTPVGRNHV